MTPTPLCAVRPPGGRGPHPAADDRSGAAPDPEGAGGEPDPEGAGGEPDPEGAGGEPDPEGAGGEPVGSRDPVHHYRPPPDRFDELLGPDGTVRPAWRTVAAAAARLGPDGLTARRQELARLLRNEGATYTATVDGRSVRRRWTLDPLPLVVEAGEWAAVAAGVAQRVALFDLVFADLYGPLRLVARGLVPPELVLGDPSFMRPVVGMEVPGAHRLFQAAVDLVRDGDGTLRSVADRTQAPSGLGYALANRTALSRVRPALHREAGAERLAGYVRALRAGIAEVAPEGRDEPRVVILTPGPLSETYFEHAYLAAYLGYALVEGRDLVVDDNRVWMRSLGGLDPVDVMVRRVDEQWCDPVELRADSLLGVPGLVEVVRRGRVTVVNPLGAGLLENPALTGLLDDLAPTLLGEELALRGPATWWCGTPSGLSHVLAHLDELSVVAVPASPPTGPVAMMAPGALSSEESDVLRRRITAHPERWVGQELLTPGTAPAVAPDGTLEPRPVTLRAFAVADSSETGADHHGYRVLPGGLTQVGAPPPSPGGTDSSAGSGGRGAASKDTWVTSEAPALQQSTWLRSVTVLPHATVVPEATTPLPGRVAAQLFSLGRSSEHAEGVIRLIRTVLARLDQPVGVAGGAESLLVLLAAAGGAARSQSEAAGAEAAGAGAAGAEAAGSGTAGSEAADRRVLELLVDARVDGSLVFSLEALVEAAYTVREQLSVDTWPLVGDLEEEAARLRNRPPSQLVAVQPNLQRLLQALLALAGLSAENMERDPTWRFLDAGRRIERAAGLVRLVRTVLVRHRAAVVEDLLTESLLETSESLIVFRRRSGLVMHVAGALDLLLYDVANPRSVLHQLDVLVAHLAELPKRSPAQRLGVEEQLALEAATALRLTTPDALAAVDPMSDHRRELDRVLGRVDAVLGDLFDALQGAYFAHERLSTQTARVPEAPVPSRPAPGSPS